MTPNIDDVIGKVASYGFIQQRLINQVVTIFIQLHNYSLSWRAQIFCEIREKMFAWPRIISGHVASYLDYDITSGGSERHHPRASLQVLFQAGSSRGGSEPVQIRNCTLGVRTAAAV